MTQRKGTLHKLFVTVHLHKGIVHAIYISSSVNWYAEEEAHSCSKLHRPCQEVRPKDVCVLARQARGTLFVTYTVIRCLFIIFPF